MVLLSCASSSLTDRGVFNELGRRVLKGKVDYNPYLVSTVARDMAKNCANMCTYVLQEFS